MTVQPYEVRDNRHGSVGVERRDPQAATAGYAINGIGRPQVAEWDANNALKNGYYASWLVNRAINILADTVASLPFRAGADLEKPNEFSQNAPLARLLGPPPESPNPEMSARKLWKLAVINYLVTGRFGWEIEYGAGREVIGLWHLAMGGLNPVPEYNTRRYFQGFMVDVPNAAPKPLAREQVVYGWNASPDDVRQAESILKSLRLNVSIMIALDQYNYSFVMNDAKPANVVVHGPLASIEATEAFRRKFLGDYRGPQNAGKTAFMEVDPDDSGQVAGLLDIKQIGMSAKDSQLVQVYDQQLQAVSGGTGVPMSLLDASGRTFDNAGQEAITYWTLTVKPLLSDLQDVINRDLAPKVGTEVGWFDLSDVEALRPQFATGVLMSDVSGDMTRNERRSFASLGPVDEAQLAKEKQEAIDLAQAAMPPAAPDPAGGDDPTPAKKNGVQDDSTQKPIPAPRPATREITRVHPYEMSDSDFADGEECWCGADEDDAIHRKKRSEERHRGPEGHDHIAGGHVGTSPTLTVDAAIERARKASVARTASLLGNQLKRWDARSESAALSRAEGKRGRQALERGDVLAALYDQDFWLGEARAALEPVYEAAVGAATAALAGLVPLEADMTAWVVQRADTMAQVLVARRAGELAGLIADARMPEMLVHAIHSAHVERGDLTELAEPIFDDAVRAITGVPRTAVQALLVKMTAGEIDLDRAMEELSNA